MDRIFLTVLNMSLTAGFIIAAVLLARLLLRRAPKMILYALWVVVLFRLVFPFTIESVFSLMPFNAEIIPPTLVAEHINSIDSGIDFIDVPVNDFIGQMHEEGRGPDMYGNQRKVYPLRGFVYFGAYLWLAGAAVLLLYAAAGYIRLKRRVSLAVRVEGIVYETDRIDSPFVLGLFRPRIYIPTGMDAALAAHIIEHERTHIRRRDYIVSVIAFAALALHWFNPLVWGAYTLMLRDMESSCDEAVLRNSNGDIRREYSSALLGFSGNSKQLSFPLAFGEQSVKERVKNVLNFKKPPRVIIAAAVAVAAALSVGFAVNRTTPNELIHFSMTEYDNMVQFRNDGVIYSPYIVDGELQSAGGWRGLKEIGFAFGMQGEKYRIFERKGYLIDEFIVIQDDGFMNPTVIYKGVSESPSAVIAPERAGPLALGRYIADDGLTEVVLHDNREFYIFRSLISYTPQGGYIIDGNSLTLVCSEDEQYIFTYNGKSLTFESGTWLENWIDKGTAFSLSDNQNEKRIMTLDDVRSMAQTFGTELTINHLRDFIGRDVGSGRYIMLYEVEGGYRLIANAGSYNDPYMLVGFGKVIDGELLNENAIDIRYYDVDKYIADGTRELVRPLPEPRETPQPREGAP